MVTALPFFSPFFIANFYLFFQKGKSCLQLYLFLFVFVSVLFLLCWESLLLFSSDLAPIHFLPPHLHLDPHVPPLPPLCPWRRRYAWPFQSTGQQIIPDDINVKTNDDNLYNNVDDNGAAGGSVVARQTKTTKHQNRHVFVSS